MILLLSCLGCARHFSHLKLPTSPSYTVKGKAYAVLKEVPHGFTERGIASWYGPGFHGRKTAAGDVYNMYELTAAHKSLPLHTLVKVTNLDTQKDVLVRINDRGPFIDDRVIDLSFAAAQQLGMVAKGTAPVQVTVVSGKEGYAGSAAKASKDTAKSPVPNPFYRLNDSRVARNESPRDKKTVFP